MKEVFDKYVNEETKLEKWQFICIFCIITVISGLIGFIYEFIFYYFNGGMKEFYMQGGNFLPWINIYAIGALLIILLTYRYRKKPSLVFTISFISTGLLEYFSGFIIYKLGNGLRYWDYNTEILNFGNIGGFVCLRSVLIFGLSALLLMYVIFPFVIYISKKENKKKLMVICITLLVIVLFDEFYNLILTKMFNLPSAYDFYTSFGIKYVE